MLTIRACEGCYDGTMRVRDGDGGDNACDGDGGDNVCDGDMCM